MGAAALAVATGVARAETVLCPSVAAPPGALFLYPDGPTAPVLEDDSFIIDGSDHLLDGTSGPQSPVFGIATRSEANAQEVRDALGPDSQGNVVGLGFVADPLTPSVGVVPGPDAAMVDQLVTDLLGLGYNEFAVSQINNSNDAVYGAPVCGIGCCSGGNMAPVLSHFPLSSVTISATGNVSGCGIMIVDGDLTVQGTMDFQGLVIVRGRLTVETDPEYGLSGHLAMYGSAWTRGFSLAVGGSALVRYSADALAFADAAGAAAVCQTPVCGDGVRTYDEECDDGNTTDGDCCSPGCTPEASGAPCPDDGTPCTSEVCDGQGTCVHAPLAGPCDDGDACTDGDTCVAGACTGGAAVECGACMTCDPAEGCVGAPATGCRQPLVPHNARLALRRDPSDPARDRLAWTWRTGEATALSDFGDELSVDDYTLCVFAGDDPPSVLSRTTLPAGGSCGAGACWSRKRNGWLYRDQSLAHGILRLRLTAGSDGHARIHAVGKGAELLLGDLPAPLPVTAQLRTAGGACWEARYPETSVVQDERRLEGRGAP